MKRIFISSPFHGLQEERRAVQRALNRMSFGPIAMEHFGSYAEAPIERCIALIRTADFVVMLVGGDLGTKIADSDHTYTEAEYHAATETGIPVLAYFRAGGPFPLVESFRESVAMRRGYSFFTSPDDLSWKLVSDLAREALMPPPETFLFDRFRAQKEILIERLNARAEIVAARFAANGAKSTSDALAAFRKLHATHVAQIADGNFAHAHETLRDIYNLLDVVAATNGIGDPRRLYQRSLPIPVQEFVRSEYLAGENAAAPSSPFSSVRLYDHVLSS
jgi:hypothetical protein